MAIEKKRLDVSLHEQYPSYSRKQLQSWIMQGKVTVAGTVVTKPGQQVSCDAQIVLSVTEPKFVGRAGFKLEKALDYFALDLHGLVALDAGLSTGGFTDCLLQRGVIKVFGVDVGYGQVHEKIRRDDRVVVLERTNLRHVTPETIGEPVDLVTLDLSFISVLKVIDPVIALLKEEGMLIVLIKPQFEAGKEQVGRGGIIKDPVVHESVVQAVTAGIEAKGFKLCGVTDSPITGADGNKEFLACFKKRVLS